MAEPHERDAVPDVPTVPPDGATLEAGGETWLFRGGMWGVLAKPHLYAARDWGAILTEYWRERELRRRAEARTCEWKPWEESAYDTGCGGVWDFEQGGPPENEAHHCPICGGRIVVVSPLPEEASDAHDREGPRVE